MIQNISFHFRSFKWSGKLFSVNLNLVGLPVSISSSEPEFETEKKKPEKAKKNKLSKNDLREECNLFGTVFFRKTYSLLDDERSFSRGKVQLSLEDSLKQATSSKEKLNKSKKPNTLDCYLSPKTQAIAKNKKREVSVDDFFGGSEKKRPHVLASVSHSFVHPSRWILAIHLIECSLTWQLEKQCVRALICRVFLNFEAACHVAMILFFWWIFVFTSSLLFSKMKLITIRYMKYLSVHCRRLSAKKFFIVLSCLFIHNMIMESFISFEILRFVE